MYRICEYYTKDGALLPLLAFGKKVLAEVKFEQREE